MWAFAVGLIILTVLPLLQSLTYRAPPPKASLGTWSLVDDKGQPIGSETLKGQVWIASFFFARCPSVCPKQQADFKKLLEHFNDLEGAPGKSPVRLVSFTVDPEFDTPAALAAYATRMGAPEGRWKFVTGDKAAVSDFIVKKMMLHMGERRELQGSTDLFDISHANKFVLVDQNGDVRDYWDTDANSRGNLVTAARMLAKRGPNP